MADIDSLFQDKARTEREDGTRCNGCRRLNPFGNTGDYGFIVFE